VGTFGADDALNFFEACPFAALCIGPDCLIVAANTAAAAIAGGTQALAGQPIADVLPEWTAPLANAAAPRREMALVREDGTKANVEVSIVKLGSAGLVCAVIRDIGREKMIAALQTELQRQSEKALLDAGAATRRLEYFIDMLPQAACIFDAQDRYVLWNRKYAELYPEIAPHLRPGIPFEQILRMSVDSGHMPEATEDPEAWFAARMKKQRMTVSPQEEQKLKDGRWMLHDDRRTPDGGAIGMRIDITDLKRREEALRQLFDANPMPMMLCDAATLEISSVNRAAVALYGYVSEALVGRNVASLCAPEDAGRFAAGLRSMKGDNEARTIWRQTGADGAERAVMVYVRFMEEGPQRRLLLAIADVTDRVRAEAHANHLAHHDALTGLPNRMHFLTALESALAIRDSKTQIAVHYLDLDGFKPVNDRLGHAAGDALLVEVGRRLRSVADEPTLVARLGGDEFAIMQPIGRTRPADLAQRCIAALARPFLIHAETATIGVSVGIAVSPFAALDPDGLMRAADKALYRAKAAGKNTWVETEVACV